MQNSSFDGSTTALVTSDHVDGLQTTDGGCEELVAGQQIPQAVLNDLSIMYLLQQQQQQQQSQHQQTPANNDGTALMMMSPALQSLLVSQMMAAMNPGISPSPTAAVSQYIIGASPSSDSSLMVQHQTSPTSSHSSAQHNGSTTDLVSGVSFAAPAEHLPDINTESLPKSEAVLPKKPLTPYMKFSKSIWQHVKNANPSLSVCEVGASIGRLWREMPDTDKQRYNDDFSREKAKYEAELQEYLKATGMHVSDLAKIRTTSSKKSASRDRSRTHNSAATSSPHPTLAATNQDGVLPHIGQIWPTGASLTEVIDRQLANIPEPGEIQLQQSTLNRSTQNELQLNISPQSNIADSLVQTLLGSLPNVGNGVTWLDASTEEQARILAASDPLCPDFVPSTAAVTTTLADGGLEPGEVVFEGGVAQIGPTTKGCSVISAHNVYNSYAFNPWARFRGSVSTATIGAVCERDHTLSTELRHLRNALDEKTREIGELTQDLQRAYDTIDRLRQMHGGLLAGVGNSAVDHELPDVITDTVDHDMEAVIEQHLNLESCVAVDDTLAAKSDVFQTSVDVQSLDMIHLQQECHEIPVLCDNASNPQNIEINSTNDIVVEIQTDPVISTNDRETVEQLPCVLNNSNL